jgi:hypothetical protein
MPRETVCHVRWRNFHSACEVAGKVALNAIPEKTSVMDTETPADDITDAIAQIELHRQESVKVAGLSTACNEALRKLHEILGQEQEAVQRHGPGTRHPANIRALAAAIEKVKKLAGAGSKGAGGVHMPGPRQKKVPPPGAPHQPPRNKGRRTMGRRGDR